MDINLIITLIGSVGFPIVACLCMGWFVKYQNDSFRKELADIRQTYNKEIKTVTEALNNNTLAIQKLADKLERSEIANE